MSPIPSAFYAKATLIPTRDGVYIFPAVHEFLKPVVMAARLMKRFDAPEEMRPGVLAAMANRFELHEVHLKMEEGNPLVKVSAKIFEAGRDPVDFDDEYAIVVILGE